MARVLILDQTYAPVDYASLEDAVLKMVRNVAFPVPGAEIIAVFKSPSTIIEIPSMLVLKVYVPIKKINKYGSRKLIFARDDDTCQYCGRHKSQLKEHEFMTIDHVIPSSRSERSKANLWENKVTACISCNLKKGNKLLEECGMALLNKPVRPDGIVFTLYNRLEGDQKKFIDVYTGT